MDYLQSNEIKIDRKLLPYKTIWKSIIATKSSVIPPSGVFPYMILYIWMSPWQKVVASKKKSFNRNREAYCIQLPFVEVRSVQKLGCILFGAFSSLERFLEKNLD
jgi:hypothetical protein